jgi:hypothetical protein
MGRYTGFYNAGFTTAQVEALRALSSTEVGYFNDITPGTAAASKALVLDGNKNIGGTVGFQAVNYDAGYSGQAGTFDLFPATAAKGKVTFAAADNTGDTLTTITYAGQAAARNYTVPDASTSASTDNNWKFVLMRLGSGAPSGFAAAQGSLYVDTGNGKLYICTTGSATSATFALVGTQS